MKKELPARACPIEESPPHKAGISVSQAQKVAARLHAAAARSEERLAAKREAAAQAELKDCTFGRVAGEGHAGEQASQRLYADAAARRSQQRLQALRGSDEPAFSFQPQVNPHRASVVTSIPLHRRVQAVQRERRAKLLKLRMDAEAQQAKMPTSVTRTARSERRRTAKQKQKRRYAESELKDLTFQPQISEVSRRICAQHPDLHGLPFLARQDALAKRRFSKQKDRAPDQTYAFSPNIGNADEVLAAVRPERMLESAAERAVRLAILEPQAADASRRQNREALWRAERQEVEVNQVSQKVGRRTPLEELALPRQPSKRMAQHEDSMSRDLERCCTFQPRINPTSASMASKQGALAATYRLNPRNPKQVSSKIAHIQSSKRKTQETARAQREYSELEECTFEPSTTSMPREQTDPIVVRGLARHLERQEKARKARAPPPPKPSSLVRPSVTVPRPFRLSTNQTN